MDIYDESKTEESLSKKTLNEQKSVVLTKMHDVAVTMYSGDQDTVRAMRTELHSALSEYRDLGASDEDIINLCSGYIDRYCCRN
jgi:DNA-binding transcriptional regulator YhcF (GntR family)